MKVISPDDLVPFDLFTEEFPLRTDPVYAAPEHPENMFGEVYLSGALISGHVDMVSLVLFAAQILHKNWGWTLVVKDCLRPVEAQQKMVETAIVRANPQWLQEPRFLSPPGLGGHPRGMAVDVTALDANGQDVDFGTAFDSFAKSPLPQHNPAHREHPDLSGKVRKNRAVLDESMMEAARKTGRELVRLSTEWWDFRFPASYTSGFAPVSDADLKPWQKMTEGQASAIPEHEIHRMRSLVFDRLDKFGDF